MSYGVEATNFLGNMFRRHVVTLMAYPQKDIGSFRETLEFKHGQAWAI